MSYAETEKTEITTAWDWEKRLAVYIRTVDKNPWIPKVPHPKQRVFLLLADVYEALFGGAAGGGKALSADTPIPTPSGWSTMGELKPGDQVIGSDGLPTNVLATSGIMHDRPCYRLTFDTGEQIVADAEHQWHTFDSVELSGLTKRNPEWRAARQERRASRVSGNKSETFTASLVARNKAKQHEYLPIPTGGIRTTQEIFETILTKRGRTNHAIKVGSAFEAPDADLPIDPYLLGVWLGDGHSSGGAITTADQEIIQAFADAGYTVKKYSGPYAWGVNGLVTKLRALGVFKNKHIPDIYLRASRSQRLALLQGLMDTDGYCRASGGIEFTSTSIRLAEAVRELAHSLGYKVGWSNSQAKLNGRVIGPNYRVRWTAAEPMFRLARKSSRQKQKVRQTTRFRYIVGCKKIDSVPVQCIQVDAPDSMFLAGRGMIPTHNSEALIISAAQFLHVPGYSAVLFRKTFRDLTQPGALVTRAKEWWLGKPGVHWSEKYMRFTFECPGGGQSSITFAYAEHDDDVVSQFQGSEFQFVGFDELTQHTDTRYLYMNSRIRRPKTGPLSEVPLRMRSASNPGGVGHEWVYGRFIDPRTRSKDVVFIPSRIADNPSLDQEEYERGLANLDHLTRSRLRDGDWTAYEGGRFQKAWLKYWHRDPVSQDYIILEDGERLKWRSCTKFQTCDPAASTSAKADYFVLSTWIVTPSAKLIWWACNRGKYEIEDQVKECQKAYMIHKPSFLAVEEVMNQRALAQLLRSSTTPMMCVVGVSPMGKDKLVRATGAINLAHDGRLFLPAPGQADFPLEDVESELIRFTGEPGRKDDIADTLFYSTEMLARTLPSRGVPGHFSTNENSIYPVRQARHKPPPDRRHRRWGVV